MSESDYLEGNGCLHTIHYFRGRLLLLCPSEELTCRGFIRGRASRYVRVSILLSWVALEEALKAALTIWQTRGRITGSVPKNLYERLEFLVAALGQPAVARPDFTRLRTIRNDIAHAKYRTIDDGSGGNSGS